MKQTFAGLVNLISEELLTDLKEDSSCHLDFFCLLAIILKEAICWLVFFWIH